MNCVKQIKFLFLLQILSWNAFGQDGIDSLKRAGPDTVKTVKLKLQSFSALDPGNLAERDTQMSLLPDLKNFGLALPNAYTIRLENFDHSGTSRFFQHGQNSMTDSKAFPENYVFILPNQAYSEIQTNRWRALSNSQAGFQDNFDISLIFASAFRNNITWNFSYDRQIYKGIYTHEKQRNTLFTTGLNYTTRSQNFQTNIVFTSEGHYLEHNWGVSSDTFLRIPQFSVRESVPVNNSLATTQISNRNLQSFSFIRLRKDTTLPFSKLQLRSSLGRYESEYYDPDNRQIDSLYFAYNIDSIIRLRVTEDYWTHELALHLFSSRRHRLLGSLLYEQQSFRTGPEDQSRSVVKAGASHTYSFSQEIGISSVLNFALTSHKTYPEFNITGNYEGHSNFTGSMRLYHVQRPVPNLYGNLFLNDSVMVNSPLNHSDYSLSGLRFQLKLTSLLKPFLAFDYTFYNRYFYLGSNAKKEVLNDTKILDVQAGMEANPGIWNFKLQGRLQSMQPDSIGISGWNVESQMGIAAPIFKNKVYTKLGLRINAAAYAGKPGYFPLLQWFHATGEESSTIYTLGVYAHFKVQDFQFNINLDQIDSFWEKKRTGFIHRYPVYDFMLRMSISWRFIN